MCISDIVNNNNNNNNNKVLIKHPLTAGAFLRPFTVRQSLKSANIYLTGKATLNNCVLGPDLKFRGDDKFRISAINYY